jgi:hypothetical protein
MRYGAVWPDTWIGRSQVSGSIRQAGRTLQAKDHELVQVRLGCQVDQARLLHDQMGGIWEITSRVNVPEPLSTELKKGV